MLAGLAQHLHLARLMALKTWLWNLGTAGVVVAAAGCDPTIAGGDTDSGTDSSADTEVEPPIPGTDSGPTPTGTGGYGTGYATGYGPGYGTGYGTGYYGTSYGGTDTYGDPECETDEDCELGVCIEAGKQWAYCEPLPIPGACEGEVEVELTWVREGEGAGTSAGLASDDRVVLLNATLEEVPVPVSLAPIEAGATPVPLPVTLTKGDIIVGAAGADVDADGDEDVLLSVQDDVRLRVVAMLRDGGTFSEGETVAFDTQGDPAQVRQFGDGAFELVSRLDSGLLFVAAGLGDGTFAAPAPSAWATEPLSAFAVGALDASVDDDLAVAVAGPGGQSSIEVQIDGGQLPVGAPGSDARSLHMDARTGWMITVLDTGRAPLEFGRFQLGVDVDVDTLLLLDEKAATVGSTVSDVDGDGRSDVITLHGDGHLTVVFAASTGGACTQIVETGAVFDTIHRPSSGERQGVVLSGADGVLAVRATTD